NDLSDRSIVKIDANGNVISKIMLESIGRSNYTGDDFVIRENEAIFLNAVDSRIEFFNMENGTHLKSISFSRDILSEKKRSRKIINRIYLDGKMILIGNSYKLIPFQDNSLLKQQKETKAVQFPDNRQIIFYNRDNSIQKVSGKAFFSGKSIPIRKSMHSFSGKSMVLLNGVPIQCIISATGIEIYRER
ncbi:MAG TPA: hypothetical protein VHP36_10395, partial [Chitinispirillaceae bacterium]|nr:hypothetical protein [Chitinispirillaceae bacterium]